LLDIGPEDSGLREYIDSVKKAESKIKRGEKALQAHLEGKRLTNEKIEKETHPKKAF
jgi:hypothetical protein